MNKIFILVLVLFFSCCMGKNKKQSEALAIEKQSIILEKSNLNENIIKELKYWIEEVESNIDTTWNEEKYYTIEFFRNRWLDKDLGKDTLVIISYYTNIRNYSGYKGILELDKRNIAIFDSENIGAAYYNKNVLKNVSLENFKSGELYYGKIILNTFLLKNGILIRKVGL